MPDPTAGDETELLTIAEAAGLLRAPVATLRYWRHRNIGPRFEREVDPDGLLDPVERARRAEHARKAYFLRLALASAHARGARRGGGPIAL